MIWDIETSHVTLWYMHWDMMDTCYMGQRDIPREFHMRYRVGLDRVSVGKFLCD